MTPKFLVQHSGARHPYSGLGRVLAGLQLQRLVDVDRGERAAAAGSITYDEVLLITHQDVATERKIVVEVLYSCIKLYFSIINMCQCVM